jgi:phosphoglycerate dehydrogenase-like enzyme
MEAIALVPREPDLAALFFGGLLGEGWSVRAFLTPADVPDDLAARAEVIIAAITPVDASLIGRCGALRLIQVPGHGFEHVDVSAAHTAGVPVCTVQSSGAEAHTVAEWAILAAGALSRRMIEGHNTLSGGTYANMALLQQGVFELAHKTIGIIGLGRIGREVAKRARAFDMTVWYFDALRPSPKEEEDMGVTFVELDDLLARADIVTIHVPATSKTRGLIGARELAMMSGNAILVNTARGDIVDHDALVDALRSGSIRGAALDVFTPEPPPPDDALLSLSNVLVSPHMAGVTGESVMRIMAAAAENCKRLQRGEELVDVLPEGAEH